MTTPHLLGPDFVGFQVADLDAAARFYEDVLGLPVERRTAEAVVFATPTPFALRLPLGLLDGPLGRGVAVWFAADDVAAMHRRLSETPGVVLRGAPTPGPFGLHFAAQDPFGHALVIHEAAPEERAA